MRNPTSSAAQLATVLFLGLAAVDIVLGASPEPVHVVLVACGAASVALWLKEA